MRDNFIMLAFCVFAFLVGMRIRDRIKAKKQAKKEKINKNQRPKMARMQQSIIDSEPEEIKRKRLNRERRVLVFKYVQFIVLGFLIIYMIPALVRDLMIGTGVDMTNLVLRVMIFMAAIYIFILTYLQIFNRKKDNGSEHQ